MPRVLIADDSREIRELIAHILEREGYEIDLAGDGQKAIQKIDSDGFDAILLDFMMPLASGSDVIDWIKQSRPEVAKACVIIITATDRDLGDFDPSTVYAAIPKPFDVTELRETVRACVEEKSKAVTENGAPVA